MAIEFGSDANKSIQTYVNVISSITGSAASQVDGVVSVTYGSNKSDKRKKSKNKAIDVVIYDNKLVKIEISVNIYYGYVIPVVVCKLQEKIKQEIEKSTFYKVSSVNVNVVGIVAGN
ncbi:MAG: Asp23/Gls24 family envelope stress response protein [Clostridia bacterium]|nr:Asp23/Gls24 family envelope stress response protein [Clostridia bacterium]